MTPVVPCDGQTIAMTADVEKHGLIRVSLIADHGQGIATAKPASKTVIGGHLKWQPKIQPSKIRLRSEFNKVKLYCFSLACQPRSNYGVQATASHAPDSQRGV